MTRTSGGPSRCAAMRARVWAIRRRRSSTSFSAPCRTIHASTRPKARRAVSRQRQRGLDSTSPDADPVLGEMPRRPGSPARGRWRRGCAGSSSRRGVRSAGRSRRGKAVTQHHDASRRPHRLPDRVVGPRGRRGPREQKQRDRPAGPAATHSHPGSARRGAQARGVVGGELPPVGAARQHASPADSV